jgi:hypothetical protein
MSTTSAREMAAPVAATVNATVTMTATVCPAVTTVAFGLCRHISRGYHQTGHSRRGNAIRSDEDGQGQQLAQGFVRFALFTRITHFRRLCLACSMAQR